MRKFALIGSIGLLVIILTACKQNDGNWNQPLYILDHDVRSRSISFENPTGAKGEGGQAAHPELGPGRKGSPNRTFQPGEEVVLCDIEGPGVIRHIWATMNNSREALLSMVVRAYWDGQEHPSIEMPIGNFFGLTWGIIEAYESAVHAVNPNAGMNLNLAMPFRSRARITLTNETEKEYALYYQIDYTLGEVLPDDVGRLHGLFRRENPTVQKEDFEILPRREGKGAYLGTILGIRPRQDGWWGEGEMKIYLDGDDSWPTIVGTGTEDYNLQSFGIQDRDYDFAGTNLIHHGLFSIYRWHLPDPIYWKEDIRVTIQQLGYYPGPMYNRVDDWSATTFWYEPIPSAPIPSPQNVPFDTPQREDYLLEWLLLGPYDTFGMERAEVMDWDALAVSALRPRPGSRRDGREWEAIAAHSMAEMAGEDQPFGIDLLRQLYAPRQASMAYAHQYIYSPKDQEVDLRLFSGDGVQVFLNGEEMFRSRDLQRIHMMETTLLSLVTGWNRLLLKVLQGPHGWSYSAHIPESREAGLSFALEPSDGSS